MADIVPGSFFGGFPSRFPSLWENVEDLIGQIPNVPSAISIYEDDKNVYVEAGAPGVDPKDIEVTFNKGVVWIKGDAKEEESLDGKTGKKKYYRKAARSFSYRITVPGEIDQNAEPDATYKNGIITVAFVKSPQAKPKKITLKTKE